MEHLINVSFNLFQDDDVALIDVIQIRWIKPVSPDEDRLTECICKAVDGRIHETVA